MNNIESELIGNEITLLKPRRSKVSEIAEDVAGILLIALFASTLIWFFSK